MIISESTLREMIQHSINEALSDFDGKALHTKGNLTRADIEKGTPLYHRPTGDKIAVVNSLMKNGFSREYNGSATGSLLGDGVYNNYDLESAKTRTRSYGKYIVQSYLQGGFQDFLIFNADIAKEYYGSDWEIDKQIQKLFPPKLAQDVLNHVKNNSRWWSQDDSVYTYGCLYMNDNATSSSNSTFYAASTITGFLRGKINQTKVRGIIYSDGHGNCAFVRNFSEVVPYSVSPDDGETWEVKITDNLIDRAGTSNDFQASIGMTPFDNDKTSKKDINGFHIVYQDGKGYNYIDVRENELIGDVWFEWAGNFDGRKENGGVAEVKYQGEFFRIKWDKIRKRYKVLNIDGEPVCYLTALPEYMEKTKTELQESIKREYIKNIVAEVYRLNEDIEVMDARDLKDKINKKVFYHFQHWMQGDNKRFYLTNSDVGCTFVARKGALKLAKTRREWDVLIKEVQDYIQNVGRVNPKNGELVNTDWQYITKYAENTTYIDKEQKAKLECDAKIFVQKEPEDTRKRIKIIRKPKA
jgi:hypothetical protein